MARDTTSKARLMSLGKLRECLDDARAFGAVTGDNDIYRHVQAAIAAAEKHEPADSFKNCLNCGDAHQRTQSRYCSYGCAEEDGAVMK